MLMGADRRITHRDAFLSALKTVAPAHGHSQRDAGFVLRRRAPFRPRRSRRARQSDGRRGRGDHRRRRRIDQARPSSRPCRTRSFGGWFRSLEALADLDAPISIDTSKAAVAREAARLGACVINDVWGLQRDPGMADAVAETGSAIVDHAQPRARGSDDRHPRRRRALLRALAQPRGGRRRAVRPNSARSWRRLRQDAAAEPCLHLESRSLPTLWGADPGRALPQVVHRRDH